MTDESSYLEFYENYVDFEPVGNVTTVFFDEKNQQVFSVRSGGATGILVRGANEQLCSTFRYEDKGPIISIKLSPDQRILSIQRTKTTVEFIGVTQTGLNGSLDGKEYSHSCKGKNATILGYFWTGTTELVFVTDQGLELYNVLPDRKSLKTVRQQTQPISWLTFCPRASIVLTSHPATKDVIQPFLIRGGYIYKLPKIDYEKDEKASISEKDVAVVNLYNNESYILVPLFNPTKEDKAVEKIDLHLLSKDHTTVQKTHTLQVGILTGSWALNVLDNLIVVHNAAASQSLLFDIEIPGKPDGSVTHLSPIIQGGAIRRPLARDGRTFVGVYSPHWVNFQPDIIIDAKLGYMWRLKLRLTTSVRWIEDTPNLVAFMLHRDGGKMQLLDVLVQKCLTSDLSTIGRVFDLINQEYRLHLDAQVRTNLALPASTFSSPVAPTRTQESTAKIILDQADIYTNLFSLLLEQKDVPLKRTISILMEYLRSLNQFKVPPQYFFNELLVNLLVQTSEWYQLHQLLQYHVITDSKPLACLLLSLESVYKPAAQLALDMLSRLGTAKEEICEILLSKELILPALKYVEDNSLDHIPSRKFLEATMDTKDDALFYSVFRYFEQKNLQNRGSKAFSMADHCEKYIQHFNTQWPKSKDCDIE